MSGTRMVISTLKEDIRNLKRVEREISDRINQRTETGNDVSGDMNLLDMIILYDGALSGILASRDDAFAIDIEISERDVFVISDARSLLSAISSGSQVIPNISGDRITSALPLFNISIGRGVSEDAEVSTSGGLFSNIAHVLCCICIYFYGRHHNDNYIIGKDSGFFDGDSNPDVGN